MAEFPAAGSENGAEEWVPGRGDPAAESPFLSPHIARAAPHALCVPMLFINV